MSDGVYILFIFKVQFALTVSWHRVSVVISVTLRLGISEKKRWI